MLIQEAIHCDWSLHNSNRCPSSGNSQEHLIMVFASLTLKGNVCAAVHWLMECSGSSVLKPLDSTNIDGTSITVLEPLGVNHPDHCASSDWILLPRDNLPLFEHSEITGYDIISIVHQLQGGADPGGCDASRWRDILLRYGSSSTRLHDSVAGLCHCLCISTVP